MVVRQSVSVIKRISQTDSHFDSPLLVNLYLSSPVWGEQISTHCVYSPAKWSQYWWFRWKFRGWIRWAWRLLPHVWRGRKLDLLWLMSSGVPQRLSPAPSEAHSSVKTPAYNTFCLCAYHVFSKNWLIFLWESVKAELTARVHHVLLCIMLGWHALLWFYSQACLTTMFSAVIKKYDLKRSFVEETWVVRCLNLLAKRDFVFISFL